MRPRRKLTPEKWARLEREADLLAQTTPRRQLAQELEISEVHLGATLRWMVRSRRERSKSMIHVEQEDIGVSKNEVAE